MNRLVHAFAAAALLLTCAPAAPAEPYPHLLLGNPSKAKADPEEKDNFLVKKPFYALSYNSDKGTPNWVSWRLVKDDLGEAKRVPFYPDKELPRGLRHVTPRDYTGSGFDRGHMCPHSDRASSHEASASTFAMSNIVPQAPNLNQKAWNSLEVYCRELVAKERKRLYIIAGPVGKGGTGTSGPAEVIGLREKAVVPEKCWKVIVVLGEPEGEGDDLARISKRTRVIAAVMPNDQEVGFGWAHLRTSVKKIEELTGYTFFDNLPAEVATALKEKVDDNRIPRVRPPRREH